MCAPTSHSKPMHRLIVGLPLCLCAVYSTQIFAQENDRDSIEFSLCPAKDPAASKHIPPRKFSLDKIKNTDISADFSHSDKDGSTTLDGNVIIEKDALRISADHANYDKQEETLTFSGNVHIDSEMISLDADTGTYKVGEKNNNGTFTNTKFFIPVNNMKGTAESVDTQNSSYSTLKKSSITSCDWLSPDWLLSADEIRLDHLDEYGSADDVIFRFKSVPIMYTPYIEFPTSNKRRSGLLFPSVGTSTSRGVEIAVPWYWNIAPNQDAIITPKNMVKRGLGIDGNYRYLTTSTRGTLEGAFVPDDKIADEKRYQVRYQQDTRILSNLLLDIDLQDISDSEYFNDYANNLSTTSQTVLNRSAQLKYELTDWQVKALVQDIKTIDTSTPISQRVYKRLPQVTFNGGTEINNSLFLFEFDSELVDFAHDDDTKTTGQRLTLQPAVSLPLSGTAWFFNPKIKFSHTQYNVGTQGNSSTPGTDLQVDDTDLPISSIDAGLFFEREMDGGYMQTLEPRLYYLNVPFQDQSGSPIFDTTIPTFSVAQLFRDNRFVGGDRIGDANQLTLAISSQVINQNTGVEAVRASIGQIFYFEDREVSLTNTVDTTKQSDVIAELDTTIGNWQSNIDIQWDTGTSEIAKENYFIHYLSDPRHIFNLGYRKQLDNSSIDIEQTDASFVYGLSRQYSAYARWNYSLVDRKPIDNIVGLAYDSCCWSIQLTAQRRLKNLTETSTSEYDSSIHVQFAFKGLGALSSGGHKSLLQQSIFGYTDVYR